MLNKTTFHQDSDTHIPDALKKAKWIWPVSHCWDLHHGFVLFRKTFTLKTKAENAWIYITADQSYRLYINGEYITGGPARGFQSHWPFDAVDVSSHLKEGENLIAVRAYNPGTSNFQYVFAGAAGLLAALDLGAETVVTDGTWEARRQDGIRKDTMPASIQLGFPQEHIDLRAENPRWFQPGSVAGIWKAPDCRPAWNVMPWPSLEERGIPQLNEYWWDDMTILGMEKGHCAEGFENTRDVTRFRLKEGFSFSAAKGTAKKIVVNTHEAGIFISYLIDFGKTVFGRPSLSLEGCCGGEVIDTLYVETIQDDLRPDIYMESGSQIAFGGRMICRKGTSEHEFYHPYGFRYMVVTLRNVQAPLVLKVALRWQGYPLVRKGYFDCSDSGLNKIWEACAWTQQCCSLDAYVDTPWREQAQWWGDARVQGWNTFFLNGDDRLFKRGIHSIASQMLPNGLTYGHAPTCAHSCILPDFTLIWLLTFWDHYWQTGSLEEFHGHRCQVAAALGYFEKQTHPECGLVGYDPRYWLFLDWTNIYKEGYPTLLNLWLLEALRKMEILYELSGDSNEARRMHDWRLRLEADLAALITDKNLLTDGLTASMKQVEHCSIHAQTLALMTELPGVNQEAALDEVLLPFIREEIKPETHPSAYWITYVFQVLSDRGYGAEVVAYIKKHWEAMAEHGTTWENFSPQRGDESFSHAWSAHPLFHLMQTLGGVRQTSMKWRTIRWSPVFVVESAAVRVPTPMGIISASWRRNGSAVELSLNLPEGVEAEIAIPGLHAQNITGKWQATYRVTDNMEPSKEQLL